MQKAILKATEEFLGEAIKKQLLQSMVEAGKIEKNYAIANHQFLSMVHSGK